MYKHLMEKFKINDQKVKFLVESNQDYEELFSDYESIYQQIVKYESDFGMYTHYQEIIRELESEIKEVLSKHQEQE